MLSSNFPAYFNTITPIKKMLSLLLLMETCTITNEPLKRILCIQKQKQTISKHNQLNKALYVNTYLSLPYLQFEQPVQVAMEYL